MVFAEIPFSSAAPKIKVLWRFQAVCKPDRPIVLIRVEIVSSYQSFYCSVICLNRNEPSTFGLFVNLYLFLPSVRLVTQTIEPTLSLVFSES